MPTKSKRTKASPIVSSAAGTDVPATLSDNLFFGLNLDEEQKAFRDAIWSRDKLIVYCDAKAGSGKAQPKNTVIPTPKGDTRLGDIRVGDYVFDRLGRPTKVFGVYEQGMQDTYKVSFTDGRSALCAGEHLWTYYNINGRTTRGNMVTETLNSMLNRSIKNGNDSCAARYCIPMNNAVEYPEAKLTVDPYVIGAFLGDGCCTGKYLEFSSADEEMVREVSHLLGVTYKKLSEKNYSWAFYRNGKRLRTDEVFADYPTVADYSYNKRIPEEMFLSSIEQRWSLLQGMMDTDGGITVAYTRYNVRFTSTSKNMTEDMLKILYSLGVSASITSSTRNRLNSRTCYGVHIRIANREKEKLFRLSRKKSIAMEARLTDKTRRYDRLAIHDIEKLDYKSDMVCIYVDNDEHLYLTNDYIVTHNTTVATGTAELLVKYGRYNGIVYIVAPTQEDKQGYLPGTLEEKSAPYFEGFYQALVTIGVNIGSSLNSNILNQKNGSGHIETLTHTFLRGVNFENQVVIIDEAQNFSLAELQKVLTRIHDSCKVVCIGHVGHFK